MNRIALTSLLFFSLSAHAEVDINKDCAAQYQPVLDSDNNELIAGFMLNSIIESDKYYAESLIPALIRNEAYGFKYSVRFARECLSSGKTVKGVVSTMLMLDEL